MNLKTALMLWGFVSLPIFLGIALTANYVWYGFLIGFSAGLFNILWLFRDASKAIHQDLPMALRIYYKSLFSRLGMITLVVATIGRFQPEWLFSLALGIAGGVIIPLIIAISNQLRSGRG
ncbi:MAG TPA: ATP synthase subunit I [Peptococcaceae bacterium]|nr:ATP synthase subunit I [Peptococcaceae bacterium]